MELIEAQGSIDERLEQADKEAQNRQKAVDDYAVQVAQVNATLAEIKAILEDEPRASKSDKTLVTDSEQVADLDKALKKGEPNPLFGNLVDDSLVEEFRNGKR